MQAIMSFFVSIDSRLKHIQKIVCLEIVFTLSFYSKALSYVKTLYFHNFVRLKNMKCSIRTCFSVALLSFFASLFSFQSTMVLHATPWKVQKIGRFS